MTNKDLKKGMYIVGEIRKVMTNDKGYTNVYLDIDELYPVIMSLGKDEAIPKIGDIVEYQRFGIRANYWDDENKKMLNAKYRIYPVKGENLE
jgi:hypothetical protein